VQLLKLVGFQASTQQLEQAGSLEDLAHPWRGMHNAQFALIRLPSRTANPRQRSARM
jgi:hypothetical protein